MCPPAPVPPPSDIGLYWTDEEVVMSLDRMICGSRLPGNVLSDVNPYQHKPSNLPDDIWYFIRSEEKKDPELGFWKAKGEACKIDINSVIITGWRTTFEFYEGKAPHGRKTKWVMQEYRITQKGLCEDSKPKEFSSLNRVFLSDGRSPNCEMQHNLASTDVAGGKHIHSMQSVVPNANSNTGKGSTSKSQVNDGEDETGPLAVTQRLLNHPVEKLPEMDYIGRGDYLELQDLADPESSSSSSENSSRRTMSSDECFDTLALLQELEPENNQDLQRKDAGCKFSVSASLRPNEVVMCPATSGSLFSGNRSKSPAEKALKTGGSVSGSATEGRLLDGKVSKHAIGTQRADRRNEGPSSNSLSVAASSSSRKAAKDKEKKAGVGRMKKLKKKYLCFMPF